MNWLFTIGGQSIGASALVSVPLMNIQGWFSLGLAGYISLQSKGVSRVFSNTTIDRCLLSVFYFGNLRIKPTPMCTQCSEVKIHKGERKTCNEAEFMATECLMKMYFLAWQYPLAARCSLSCSRFLPSASHGCGIILTSTHAMIWLKEQSLRSQWNLFWDIWRNYGLEPCSASDKVCTIRNAFQRILLKLRAQPTSSLTRFMSTNASLFPHQSKEPLPYT